MTAKETELVILPMVLVLVNLVSREKIVQTDFVQMIVVSMENALKVNAFVIQVLLEEIVLYETV
jgi:hypothetical protein